MTLDILGEDGRKLMQFYQELNQGRLKYDSEEFVQQIKDRLYRNLIWKIKKEKDREFLN